MSRADNPRELSDAAIKTLIQEDKCPMCLGELDTGWECNSCGYDAIPLAHKALAAKEKANEKFKDVPDIETWT